MAKMETNHSSPTPGPSSTEEINFPRADNQLPTKKKRSLPGMPDPDSEVIALSPKTLLAKNRFVCEICNKGFQRDQNLQLHRRGHNLPWKLRQRINKDVKKRVYVCPEPSCVHHEPSRALGDLTGIKKHFCRKHGEKKFKCERCSKKYAVQSDRKAHMKTCGTKEYRCDCGTLFSRRDSFVTHRAFCDALAQESAAVVVRSRPPSSVTNSGEDLEVPTAPAASSPPPTGVLSPVLSVQSSAELPENQATYLPPPASVLSTSTTITAASMVFASMLSPSHQSSSSSFTGSFLCPMDGPDRPAIDPISLSLSSSLYGSSSLFPSTSQDNRQPHYIQSPQPALSATALLQKAAQMGATSSNPSFFNGFWLPISSPTDHQDYNVSTMPPATTTTSYGVKLEKNAMASGLGLGLPCGGSSGYSDGLMVSSSGYSDGLMMSSSDLFGDKPATLDFLGLGMGGGGEGSPGGFSAFLSSISGGLDVAANTFAGVGPTTGDGWDDDPSERKPSLL